jgi:hypothetical protein
LGRRKRVSRLDIPWLDGQSTTDLPLEERHSLLKQLKFTAPMRRRSRTRTSPGKARREGWKADRQRRGSCEHRRSKLWLKMKCEASQNWWSAATDRKARVGFGAPSSATIKTTTSCRGKNRPASMKLLLDLRLS